MPDNSNRRELLLLARICGIQTSYRDMNGKARYASMATLMAVLRALGVNITDVAEAAGFLRKIQVERAEQLIEPVTVAWEGRVKNLSANLLQKAAALDGVLVLDSGEVRKYHWGHLDNDSKVKNTANGSSITAKLPINDVLPWGYHQLTVRAGRRKATTLVISAPRHAFTPPVGGRRWGVFAPLYAMGEKSGWGAGDYSDLGRLARWSAGLGGSLVGTLPLLPQFFREHRDHSPYSPTSRMFWNEFYIDIESVPELEHCAEARNMAETYRSSGFLVEAAAATLVDYESVMARKRVILELLMKCFYAHQEQSRFMAYQEYIASKPELINFARFRAVSERLRTPWMEWPERLKQGCLIDSDCSQEVFRYYLYTQFIAHEQLIAATSEATEINQALYLDLPLGVHSCGYDAWREQGTFVRSASVGAPPDRAFPCGQNWGFPPPNPLKLRQSDYRYFIQVLRHHLRSAGVLRLDHIMGLHRLFWIPAGATPADGVYVSYEAEETYAILCLESQREKAVIVGEDLGLVPVKVRRAMRRHGIYRSYVAQYELLSENDTCLDTVPAGAMAALNTHDMHPFASFWRCDDIDERVDLGVLTSERSAIERRQREAGKMILLHCLQAQGRLQAENYDLSEIYRAICREMADSPAEALLLNLDDLAGATRAQNIPGTCLEHPNWRRKLGKTLGQLSADPDIMAFLGGINERRKAFSIADATVRESPVLLSDPLRCEEYRERYD